MTFALGASSAATRPPDSHPDRAGTDDPYAPERAAWVVLSAVDGLGPIALASLLTHFGSARQVLAVAADPGGAARLAGTPPLDHRAVGGDRRPVGPALAEAIADAVQVGSRVHERMRELGLRAVTLEEPVYPTRLLRSAMPPHVLYVDGEPSALEPGQAVAVVGTRHPTTYGRTTAGRLAAALVAAGAAVVSGLAYGIDGAAHEAAIRAGGLTVGVIGGGHAVAIPRGHRRLARAIVAAGGAVVSEMAPDVTPTRGTFPRRNRIVSGLSQATVVVEAPARSGALITASWALEQGRECFVVPGGLDAPASEGCLAFLREFHGAAHIVAGIPHLIADLGLRPAPAGTMPDALAAAAVSELGAVAQRVAESLVRGIATVDGLVAATDLPVATILAALGSLDRRGLVVGAHGRYRPSGALLGDRRTAGPR